MLLEQSSPEEFFSSFSLSTMNAAKSLNRFASCMEDKRSQEVLKKAKESRTKSTEGITGWLVTEHEDWLEVHSEDLHEDIAAEEEVEEVSGVALEVNVEDLRMALTKFGDIYPVIEASLDENSMTIKVQILYAEHPMCLRRFYSSIYRHHFA